MSRAAAIRSPRHFLAAAAGAAAVLAAAPTAAAQPVREIVATVGDAAASIEAPRAPEAIVRDVATARLAGDLAALEAFRPGYRFWQHVFAIPDGSVAYGSAVDGRLLAVFPATGDWTRNGRWHDPALAPALRGVALPTRLADRRDAVATLLERAAGEPIINNPTRGRFVSPNAARYGAFIEEWGRIYERFGVPAEIGLAQAVVESGLSGTVRSEARAIGFCQWLQGNWNKLRRLAPHVIEAENQTTQAPYCAAYLTVLATKYGSFIPALSEHHAGGTNVGRTLIKGERLGGDGVRAQYFFGSSFALALRQVGNRQFTDLYRTYGPRSYRYSELVFGNTATVARILESTPQRRIHAMRVTRDVTRDEIVRATGLSAAEVKRYNPALVRRVPRGADVYLPRHVAAFGRDVAFWHRPPSDEFAAALADFMAIDATPAQWDSPGFERVLREHQRRFDATRTEEGTVMAVILAYVMEEMRTERRGDILREYRADPRIARLFEQGMRATAGQQPRFGQQY
jgi:hypothetical protein